MKKSIAIFDQKSALNKIPVDDILILITDEERVKLQHVLLTIYSDIIECCNKYNFTPFLTGGSALGAVRHHGFIPWDDDMDIGMFRDEYDRFLDFFTKEYGDKYIVSAPANTSTSRARFTKIIKKGTLFKEIDSLKDDTMNGIFVDIFPIENIPDNHIIKFFKGIRCDMLSYISSQVFSYQNRTKKSVEILKRTGRINYFVRTVVGIVFGIRNYRVWFKRFDKCSRYNKNDTRYVGIPSARKHYFGEILKRSSFFPARYIDFCDIKAPVYNDVEGYLKQQYGDYMTIPPEEKREKHYIVKLRF